MATPLGIDDEIRPELNVTPLVDVMLVLLVIFMVMAPRLARESPIDLPKAAHARAVDASERLVLRVERDGTLVLADTPVTRDELVARLRDESSRLAAAGLLLEADRGVAHGVVIEVLDACRAAGVSGIGIVTAAARKSSAVGG